MNTRRPGLFHDQDRVVFRLTSPADFRVPFTFVEALNPGTLFDRSGRVFLDAARHARLYEVVVGRDARLIGTGMFQDTFRDADGRVHEEEIGGLIVHPAARGFGIMTLLVKVMLVHRFAVVSGRGLQESYIAHVVDGNAGPIHGLLDAGFESVGPVRMHPGEFDGAMEHMIAPGENFVRFHAYRFDGTAIQRLIRELRTLRCERRGLVPGDAGLRLVVDFSPILTAARLDAVDPESGGGAGLS